MQHYNLSITTSSPVHIGASSDFEPSNYVISDIDNEKANTVPEYIICPECNYKNPYQKIKDDGICLSCESDIELPQTESNKEKSYFLYTFTPAQIAQSPIDKRRLLEVARGAEDIAAIQKFFKENISKIIFKAHKKAVVCPDIAKVYEKKFGNLYIKRNEQSFFEIERNISSTAEDIAYIPASSIKGAIRTAVLSYYNNTLKLNKFYYEKGIDYEKQLANYTNPTNDPFCQLKISDSRPVKNFITKIITAKNKKRQILRENENLQTRIEVIPSGTAFTGELILANDKKLPKYFDIDLIQKACNDFYLSRLLAEKDNMIKIHHIPETFFSNLEAAAKTSNTFIICIGKHGGAENVTINGIRKIKIMQQKGQKPKYSDHATTYWFADDNIQTMPFGWCIIQYKAI